MLHALFHPIQQIRQWVLTALDYIFVGTECVYVCVYLFIYLFIYLCNAYHPARTKHQNNGLYELKVDVGSWNTVKKN